jgi:hypothetical protein
MHSLIADNKEVIFKMCEDNHVEQLYLFGSVLDPDRFSEQSDIDILVTFNLEGMNVEDYADYYFNLLFGLEELLGREIDLTTERSIKNPFFKEEVEDTKVILFNSLERIDG